MKKAEELKYDDRNYLNNLAKEIAWKKGNLRTGNNQHLHILLDPKRCTSSLVPKSILDYIRELPHVANVLDVGCGPISSLAWLHYNSEAILLGVDLLAARYRDMLNAEGYQHDVRMRNLAGENLIKLKYEGYSYDVVHCRNALDHCRIPALVWLNMVKLLQVGGLIVQSHSLNEAEKENHRQLHQWNIRWQSKQLIIYDYANDPVDLTSHLPLELLNYNTDGGWISTCHRKTEDVPVRLEYLEMMQTQILNQYHKLSMWCEELERFVNEHE